MIPIEYACDQFVDCPDDSDEYPVNTDCPAPVCGNGTEEIGEQCDDGNVVDGDGCSATCTVDGVPAEWVCDPGYYNQADGCDCDCGALDPDCEIPDADVYNCSPGATCNAQGQCEGGLVIPPEWTCGDSFYGADDGCDCGCGVIDPDCADATVGSCEWCGYEGSCSTPDVDCPSNINPTDNSQCT